MPRLKEETYGSGDQRWLGGTHGIYNCRSSALNLASFVEATHYPDGYIPSGTQLNVADESAAVPFTGVAPAAGDPKEVLGFLYTDQQVVGTEDINAPVLRHGTVNVDHLPNTYIASLDPVQFVFVGTGA